MAKRERMGEDALRAIVTAEVESALGYMASELATQREAALDAYLGRPNGKEIEGRSAVVDTAVQDTVEWILPSLIRVFVAGENAVELVPQGADAEELAEQATAYCNWVWDRENPGFVNFHTWFKDALISKLGTLKIYWEESEQWKREAYDGLDDASFSQLVNDPDVEIIEHDEEAIEVLGPDGLPISAASHNVVVRKRKSRGKTCIEPVPPEEMLFSRDARDVQNCRMVAHRKKETVSDLIERYPSKRKVIEDLSTDESG